MPKIFNWKKVQLFIAKKKPKVYKEVLPKIIEKRGEWKIITKKQSSNPRFKSLFSRKIDTPLDEFLPPPPSSLIIKLEEERKKRELLKQKRAMKNLEKEKKQRLAEKLKRIEEAKRLKEKKEKEKLEAREKTKKGKEEQKRREKEIKLVKIRERGRKGLEEKAKREIQKAIKAAKKQSLIKRIKIIRKKEEKPPIKNIPEMKIEMPARKEISLPKTPKPKKRLNEVGLIKQKIYDARDALTELNLKRAKDMYIEVMASYNKLKDKDKAKVYEEIKELYNDRKHAESMFGRK